ncbi:hypothetical protein PC121_g9775 [Phytophthora cactorum]|nr:hypothetical protein PC121_g9775 [Phytophthora cactorum]
MRVAVITSSSHKSGRPVPSDADRAVWNGPKDTDVEDVSNRSVPRVLKTGMSPVAPSLTWLIELFNCCRLWRKHQLTRSTKRSSAPSAPNTRPTTLPVLRPVSATPLSTALGTAVAVDGDDVVPGGVVVIGEDIDSDELGLPGSEDVVSDTLEMVLESVGGGAIVGAFGVEVVDVGVTVVDAGAEVVVDSVGVAVFGVEVVEAEAVEDGVKVSESLEDTSVEVVPVIALAVDSTVPVTVLVTETMSDSFISRPAKESCKVLGTSQSAATLVSKTAWIRSKRTDIRESFTLYSSGRMALVIINASGKPIFDQHESLDHTTQWPQ